MKKQILILDCRPIQSGILNGVTITTTNWFNQVIQSKNEFQEIILWTNSKKKPKLKLIQNKKTIHYHTKYSNLFLTLLWKFSKLLTIESILKIPKRKNQITYFCPDLRPLNLREQTKSYLYLHDIAYLKFPQFYSLKSRIFYKLINPQKTASKVTKILTNSKFTKSELKKHLNIPDSKIQIQYPQLDWAQYQSNPSIPTKKQFLALGAFQKRKNTDQIIEQFAQFTKKNPDYQLILVGGFDKTFSQKHFKLHPNIIIKSQISEKEKIKLIQESAALIYIPTYEGFGLPILEAMALEKPIICTKLKVFKELFGNYPIYLKNTNQLHTQLNRFAN